MCGKELPTVGVVYSTRVKALQQDVKRLLDSAGLSKLLLSYQSVLIKPNLVEALEPPVTTPVELVEAIILYLQNTIPDLTIAIGEGTGSIQYDTFHCFESLGYVGMASRLGVELIDLNKEELVSLTNPDCRRWPQMHLPKLLYTTFLLSVPVLKAHSLAGVTLTMKNMMGCAPPTHYQQGGCWGKSSFHERIQDAVFDLNRYRTPDFTLLDATIGMSQAHLWGDHCDPPVGILAASADPVAIDRYGCDLLRRDWQNIGHILKADGILGCAEPLASTQV